MVLDGPLTFEEETQLRTRLESGDRLGLYGYADGVRGIVGRLLATIEAERERLDVERLGLAVDAHNEDEEPFSPVHCNTGDRCHEAIASKYEATR